MINIAVTNITKSPTQTPASKITSNASQLISINNVKINKAGTKNGFIFFTSIVLVLLCYFISAM